jgi:hypothetical protein
LLVERVKQSGHKWALICQHFQGRSENDVKNRWHSHIKHRLDRDFRDQVPVPPPATVVAPPPVAPAAPAATAPSASYQYSDEPMDTYDPQCTDEIVDAALNSGIPEEFFAWI